jgi:hypothetical protein
MELSFPKPRTDNTFHRVSLPLPAGNDLVVTLARFARGVDKTRRWSLVVTELDSPLANPLDEEGSGTASELGIMVAHRDFLTSPENPVPRVCYRQVGDRYQFFTQQPDCSEAQFPGSYTGFPGETWQSCDCWANVFSPVR